MQYLEVVKARFPVLERVWPTKQNYKVYAWVGGAVAVYVIYKSTADHLTNFVFTQVMVRIHKAVTVKDQLFTEAFSKITSNSDDKSRKLEILEIGIGPGSNFKLYPKNSNLTILDKTDKFLPSLKESIKKENRQDLTISKLVVNPGENMKDIPSNSMDAVVHTFVICSVGDPKLVFQEIYRVLKPGGVNVFIDHATSKDTFIRRILRFLVGHKHGHSHDSAHGHSHEHSHSHSHSHSHGHSHGGANHMKMTIESSNKLESLFLYDYEVKQRWLSFLNPVVYGYGIKKPN